MYQIHVNRQLFSNIGKVHDEHKPVTFCLVHLKCQTIGYVKLCNTQYIYYKSCQYLILLWIYDRRNGLVCSSIVAWNVYLCNHLKSMCECMQSMEHSIDCSSLRYSLLSGFVEEEQVNYSICIHFAAKPTPMVKDMGE